MSMAAFGRRGAGAAAVKSTSQYKRAPIKTYTDACEAPSAFWETGAIPLKAVWSTTPDGARMARVVKTYEHPAEKEPHKLSFSDISSMYCVSNDVLLKHFQEGVGGKVMQLFPPGHPRGFLYRKESHLINTFVSKLPFYESRLPALKELMGSRPGLCFDGETGVGKSALMAQCVHFARSRDIFTIYVPNAKTWTHGEWAWPSNLLPGFWDAPDASRCFLETIMKSEERHLKAWKLNPSITPFGDLPMEGKEKHPTTLYELCKWSINVPAPSNVDRQSVAIKFFLDEIMAEKKKPILFVVDGVNLFSHETHYRLPHPDFYRSLSALKAGDTDVDLYPREMPRIPASRMVFVRALNALLNRQEANKFFITSTSRDFKKFDGVAGFKLPDDDEDREKLDEYAKFDVEKDTVFHPMSVENFDEYEFRAFLRFIVNSGELAGLGWGPLWHYASGFETKLAKIDFMSDRNPQRVIEHFHQELTWEHEYSRIRQKQHIQKKK